MQSGPHPAPIFANKPAPVVAPSDPPGLACCRSESPATAKIEVAAAHQAARRHVAEIQRELAKRGFYDGAADGVYGPKTDAAIRDFEQAAGLRASAEPNEALLAAIIRSNVKATPVETAARSDRRAARAKQALVAIQRALADFGYGQIKPNGTYDPRPAPRSSGSSAPASGR